MSKTKLGDTKGFTPLVDNVMEVVGLNAAVVFGVVWRFCQMESGECYASIKRIAEKAGLSEKTVQRKLKILVEKGYLQDKTPKLRYSPHTYIDTGKAKFRHPKIVHDKDFLNEQNPHTAYKSRHMDETLANVVDNLDDQGELTSERYMRLEDKLNPPRIPKSRTIWEEDLARFKQGRSESPTRSITESNER